MIRLLHCVFRRRIPPEVQRLVKALTSERDAAYQCGYASGYVDGVEAGLRQRLDDARAALRSAS